MPIGPARMPLLEHLGELRMRLVRIVVAVVIAMCVFYFAADTIIPMMLQPIEDCISTTIVSQAADGETVTETAMRLIALDPFEGFATKFKVSIWTALVATAPLTIWQLLAFFLPALKPKERKWFAPTFAAAVLLFVAGMVFCYFLILPAAFSWLTGESNSFGEVFARASTYVSMVIKFEIGFGLAFEMPLLVFYLVLFEIVPYKKLRESWRIVYVVLLVVAAVVTADPSPVTMLLMYVALVVLYELSLLIARVALRKRLKKRAAQEAAEEAEEAADAAAVH